MKSKVQLKPLAPLIYNECHDVNPGPTIKELAFNLSVTTGNLVTAKEVAETIHHIRTYRAIYGFSIAPIKKGAGGSGSVTAVDGGSDTTVVDNDRLPDILMATLGHVLSECTASETRLDALRSICKGMPASRKKRRLSALVRDSARVLEDARDVIALLEEEKERAA